MDTLGLRVAAVMFFGEQRVARCPTRERAEWRAEEPNERAERNPRGYVRYVVWPATGSAGGK